MPDQRAYACYPPLFQHFRNGQCLQEADAEITTDQFFKGRSTWLKLERRAGKVVASYSHDGKGWTEAKQIVVDLPRRVRVGVAAINASSRPLTVEFEDFRVDTR
jgi:regulation of enolase protein 1 (concanavalin A-like superfamily)